MSIFESFRSGLGSIFQNKLRSFLTMLGVIIGVTSVILLTSIGEGVKHQVAAQVESLGANLLYVIPGKINMGTGNGQSKLGVNSQGFGSRKSTLTYDDALSLKGRSDISAATGVYGGVDKLDKLNLAVSTTGVDEDFNIIRNLDIQYGRFINRDERIGKERVAVIGDEANKELFNGGDSTGRTFKLNGLDYRVVGILRYKKPENMGPQSEDLNVRIYLPITEMLSRSKDKYISQILVQASSGNTVDAAEATIKGTLGRTHTGSEFSVLKQQDILDRFNSIMGVLNTALGGIAAISLVVGGIGIMNIMLVSVTERTREIGIRKAIGANRFSILTQFLIEAVAISLSGGILGLAAGVFGSRLITSLFPSVPTLVSIQAAVVSLIFTFVIGLFFGVYPAVRASKLDPIEALRSE